MIKEKIDFVILWVDGNDPEWLKEKAKYSPKKEEDGEKTRYRDWDNLQYWFRGVEKFTPWVNRIHFVTWGHLPKWLNVDHPKLNIVRHEDYIPQEYLPTFSANPIEVNLHRIEGLEEQFVFFNDDMFITDYVNEKIFFRNGLPRDFAVLSDVCSNKRVDPFIHIVLNDIGVINENFDKSRVMHENIKKIFSLKYPISDNIRTAFFNQHQYFTPFLNHHLPSAFLKSTFGNVWEKEKDALEETCTHRFRNITDLNQYVFRYWQLTQGKFEPISRKKLGKAFTVQNDNEELYEAIAKGKYKMICINDSSEAIDFEKEKAKIIQCFNELLSNKSNFEI